jgi:exopolysaccharide biosynthesis polyprenyl glycosylphosphotransferase
MRQQRITRLSIQLFLLDIILTPIALYAASVVRILLPFGQQLSPEAVIIPWPVYLVATACTSVAFILNGVYDPERVLRWFHEAYHILWAALASIVFLAGVLYMTYREISRLQFIYFFIIQLGLILASRAILRIVYRLFSHSRPGTRSKVLIIGAGELGQRVARVILDHSRWGFDLIGYLDDDPGKQGQRIEDVPVLAAIDQLMHVVTGRDVGEVWIALPTNAHERLKGIVAELEHLPVRIKVVPDYFPLALVRARAEIFAGIPLIGLREPVIEGMPRLAKRVFDLVVGGILLIVLSPFLGGVALLIRLDSTGPAIFRQQRVGENGRLFDMFKFRTMVAGAETQQAEVVVMTEDGQVLHKRKDDPRVTRMGRFLRRYSLDELPQLWNVLRGELSMVGPRPEMPWLVEKYDSWQRKRFAVPQGLTGWWQINGRSDKPMHLNTDYDLYYVYNYSLWLDIQILLRTPMAVLRGRGAF